MNSRRRHEWISQPLFADLESHLSRGMSVALLGPRGAGKGFVLGQLAHRARQANQRTIEIDLLGLREATLERFVETLAAQCAESPPTLDRGQRLGGVLEDLLKAAAFRTGRLAWLLVRGLLDIPVPFARAVLEALQACRSEHVGVIVTGTADFVPLTYGSNSPFRDVPQFVIKGMDVDTTGAYVVSRKLSETLIGKMEEFADNITQHIDRDALEFLHHCTDGYMHFVQEIIVAAKRHPVPDTAKQMEDRWSKELVTGLIENYFKHHIETNLFLREVLRAVERHPAGFDTLLRLYESDGAAQDLPPLLGTVNEYDLEVSGIVKPKGRGQVVFSSPLWQRYLSKVISPLYVADVYARQKRWEEAWEKYAGLSPEQRDRPATGDGECRWQASVVSWENSFLAKAAEKDGKAAVYRQFLASLRYLFGFDSGGVFDFSFDPPQPILDAETSSPQTLEPASNELLEFARLRMQQHAMGDGDPRDSQRLRLVEPFPERQSFPSHPNVRPVLVLERYDPDREIDGSLVRLLLNRVAPSFLVALSRADQNEYRETLVRLRKLHLQVIKGLSEDLALRSFNMAKFLERAADLLVDPGGYLRVQFCLVDPRREYITAVVSRAAPGHQPINFPTRRSLTEKPTLNWDVQPWVVHHKLPCVVPDASNPDSLPGGPTTQDDNCRALGMKAIVVVPLIVCGEVLGTIHIERKDQKVPSQAELELLEILSDELALAFSLAKRLTLLQEAINNLPDEVRIIDLRRAVVFHNSNAADVYGGTAGWLQEPVSYAAYRDRVDDKVFMSHLDHEIERAGNRRVHRLLRDEGGRTVLDWQLVPIHTFEPEPNSAHARQRGFLLPPEDWLNGYVERVHDLSKFYRLYSSLNVWLAQPNVKTTTARILEYFRDELCYRWCRIYLIEKAKDTNQDVLYSYAQFGLKDPTNVRSFEKGELKFRTHERKSYGWHLFEHRLTLSLCRHDPDFSGSPCFYESPGKLPELRLRELDHARAVLEKQEDLWIEAPLLVGERRVGLLSVSLPPKVSHAEDIPPTDWESLRWTVLGVAIALHNAIRTEQEGQQRSEQALRLAAALAVHQLTNKLLPVESFIDRLGKHTDQLPERLRESLSRGHECLAKGKAILRDLRRYASDQPFASTQAMSVRDFLNELAKVVRERETTLGPTEINEPVPQVQVNVCLDAFREIVEILYTNSIMHSGRIPAELDFRFGADVVAATLHPKPIEGGEWVRLTITDNGIGVPDDMKPNIFEPFVTTHAQGTGLGLAIAKKFVSRHGGDIVEDGVYSRGASFSIYLPILTLSKGSSQ